MFTVRKSDDRGQGGTYWLESKHSFSFADYYDPRHMGFGPLRVINEDWIAPDSGFGMHPHRNMEIITYVLSGEISHEDSMGSKGVTAAGDIQVMSAGSGVLHSEFNRSPDNPVHLLQIWVMPDQHHTEPGYRQQAVDRTAMQNRFHTIVSNDGRDGSLTIRQNAQLQAAMLGKGQSTTFTVEAGRKYWLQMAQGAAAAQGHDLAQGDALAIADEQGVITVTAAEDAEVLLFDLPA